MTRREIESSAVPDPSDTTMQDAADAARRFVTFRGWTDPTRTYWRFAAGIRGSQGSLTESQQMRIQTLQELIARLKRNPHVLGMARYGRRRVDDMSPGGDFDLFVLVDERPDDLESIHFHVGDVPVDLNLRTLNDLSQTQPLSDVDRALPTADILYDPTDALARTLPSLRQTSDLRLPPLTEHEVHYERFCGQHVLDKVKGRLESQPLLCEFLLATNMFWLVQAYFRVRSIPYPGENGALTWLEEKDRTIYETIERFYAAGSDLTEKLALSEQITDRVLAPIQGRWRKGALLAFGTRPDAADLDAKARNTFDLLLGDDAESFARKGGEGKHG